MAADFLKVTTGQCAAILVTTFILTSQKRIINGYSVSVFK